MKLHRLIWILALVAVAAGAQEQAEENRIKVKRKVLIPGGSAVFVDEHGKQTAFAGPELEIFGDGSHYVHLLGHPRHIGVQLTDLTPELREHFGVDKDVGVMVARTLEGQPAVLAGVEVGDIITAIDGAAVDSPSDLTRVIRGKEVGETVDLEIWRDGASRRLDVPVGERQPRRIVDIRPGRTLSGDRRLLLLPEIRMRDFQIDADALEKLSTEWEGAIRLPDIQGVLEHLGQYFSSEDWQERLHQIEKMDFKEVESKMKSIELRLQQLESELEEAEEN